MLGSRSICGFTHLEELDASNIKYINEEAINGCCNLKHMDVSSCIRFGREAISANLTAIKFAPIIEYLGSCFLCIDNNEIKLNFDTILDLKKSAFFGIYVREININSIPYIPYFSMISAFDFSLYINKVNGIDNRYLDETRFCNENELIQARKDRKIYLNMSKDEFLSKILSYDKIHNLNCSIILNDGVRI